MPGVGDVGLEVDVSATRLLGTRPGRHLPGDGDLGLDKEHPDASTTELRLRRFLKLLRIPASHVEVLLER